MVHNIAATGFARLSVRQARVVLIALAVSAVCFVGIAISPLAKSNVGKPPRGASDVVLYWAEVDRIRCGEGYYDASLAELTARGYPTRSLFNWRTPLPMWLLGHLPDPVVGKVLLGLLAGALLLVGMAAVAREPRAGVARPLGTALLLTGPLLPCVLDDLFVTPALWSGVLIALSLCAFGIERPGWGVALGIAAVFFRELALPYCVLSAGLAWRSGKRKELLAWAIGLAAWLAYMAMHWWQVTPRIPPDAIAHRQGWVQFGGAAFVLSTVQMNGYLLLLPHWVTAIYFTAAMFGLAGWDTRFGRRVGLTVALFVVAFGIAGQDFNQYWGVMVAPLYCFGVARFATSVRDAWRQAVGNAGGGAEYGVRSTECGVPSTAFSSQNIDLG